MATFFAIPQPPTVPFLANTPLMDREHPNETFKLLADQYGEIYQFKFPDGRTVVHINTYNLLAQISDDKRFKKVVTSPLNQVRDLVGDGLFTGELEEVNWGMARSFLHTSCDKVIVDGTHRSHSDACVRSCKHCQHV